MEKTLFDIVKNYYWFLVVIAASLVFGARDVSSILIVVIVAVFAKCFSTINRKKIDAVVFLFLLYSLSSYFFVEKAYPLRLYYLGIRAQIVPILFYYIARSEKFKSDAFFENFKAPLFFAMICGVYFYFLQPDFYVSYKASVIWDDFNSDISSLSGHLLYELTRFSSFWPHSYFMGYSSLFLFMYASKKIVVDNYYKKFDLACFALSFFCLFFAQQRVSIAFCLFFFFALTVYSTIKRLPSMKLLYFLWFVAIVFGVGIVFVVMNYLSVDFVEYVLNRTVNYDGNIVSDRISLFDKFVEKLSFLGAGLGCYGHGAAEMGYPSIPDSDYVRVPAELGVVGFIPLMGICLYSLFCGTKIFKYAFFEVCTLCFCLVAMIGAAVWELGTLQPFLYWFCIGHIVSKYSRRDKLEMEYDAYFKTGNIEADSEGAEVNGK